MPERGNTYRTRAYLTASGLIRMHELQAREVLLLWRPGAALRVTATAVRAVWPHVDGSTKEAGSAKPPDRARGAQASAGRRADSESVAFAALSNCPKGRSSTPPFSDFTACRRETAGLSVFKSPCANSSRASVITVRIWSGPRWGCREPLTRLNRCADYYVRCSAAAAQARIPTPSSSGLQR